MGIKSIVKDGVVFSKRLIDTCFFFFNVTINVTKVAKPLKKGGSGNLVVLANGPSLKQALLKMPHDEEFKNTDFLVVNFFAFEPSFASIRPKYYCFADPMFFLTTYNEANVRRLFAILETEVDWEMNVYVPANEYHQFLAFSKLTNRQIKICRINTFVYSGFERWRHFFYNKSIAAPFIQNVSVFAIFLGMNLGYTFLRLYGVDHTFLNGITVNGDNQLCNKEVHFYDNGDVSLKPILRIDTGLPWKISEYLMAMHLTFRGHDELAAYSRFLRVRIVNCTKDSMIDAYERAVK